MTDKYTKGCRTYHLVEEGKSVTKCGFDFTDVGGKLMHLEDIKTNSTWPTCEICEGFSLLPEEIQNKLHRRK